MQECWPWNLFVNHHGQSGEWRLRFPTPVLSSTALTAFILPLSNGVQWNQGVKGTICCRITECAELGGTCALRLPFSRLQLVILIPPSPSDGQLDTLFSIPYSLNYPIVPASSFLWLYLISVIFHLPTVLPFLMVSSPSCVPHRPETTLEISFQPSPTRS